MKLQKYPSLSRAASALKKRGFSERFILKNNAIKHKRSGRVYRPEDIAIIEYHRFFSEAPQDDQVAIIFALETSDGLQGLLPASYDAYGKVELLEFMDNVKIKSRREELV